MVTKDPRCLNHMFAAEIFMHRFLLSSAVRTLKPKEADWFYTPVYTTCDLTPAGLPLPFKSPRVMRSAIQYISNKWPFWNRTDGADHFFVVPHDFGACFHYQVSSLVPQTDIFTKGFLIPDFVISYSTTCNWRRSVGHNYEYIFLYFTFCSKVICVTVMLVFAGRKSYWTWHSPIAATCYIGANVWTGESCLPEGGVYHHPTLCSSSENAGSPYSPGYTTVNLHLL